jgi:hypothetical protein
MIHFKDEKEEIAYRLADNKTGEKAGWDFDLLDANIEDIMGDFDPGDYGFDFDLWSDGETVDEDEVVGKAAKDPDAPKPSSLEIYDPPSVVSAGDEIRLGRHMLVCGRPDRDRIEIFAAGRRTFVLYDSDGPFGPDDAREAVTDGAAFAVRPSEDSREAVGDLFYTGWAITDFLQWKAGEGSSRAFGTIALVGVVPDPAKAGDGTFDGTDPYGWLVDMCSSEDDVVVDLTGMRLLDACDRLGRACVCYCPDPSACDCVVADYREAHPE